VAIYLVGESSGKASKGVAKYIAGMSTAQEGAAVAACSNISRAKMVKRIC